MFAGLMCLCVCIYMCVVLMCCVHVSVHCISIDTFTFRDATTTTIAHNRRHPQLNHHLKNNQNLQTQDEEKLLSFKKSLIKKALLKQNRELDAEAIQVQYQCDSNVTARYSPRRT